MPATKFEKGKVKEQVDPKVLGVLSAAFGYKISGVDDLDYEEYHNELREAMVRGKDTLSPAQMAVLSSERTRIRAQKSVYKADFSKTMMTAADIKKGSAIQLAENSALSLYKGGVGKSPVEESTEEIVGDIDDKLDDLLNSIRGDKKLEEDAAKAARKKAEDEARARKEKNLERWEAIKETTSKIVKPFRSLWDQVWGFLKNILLGNFLLKFIGWLGQPKNQSKLKNIFRFMKDFWPPLLAAYILFGTSFGRMATFLVATIAKSTIRLTTYLIPKLAAAIAKVKALKIGKMLGGLLGGGKLKGLTGLFNMGAGAFAGGGLVQQFANGGQVPGSGSGDTVPAMLTPGEFVMSKGAVQKFGADTLSGMNAAAGGTNQPEMGLPGLGGGGGGTDALTEQAKVKTWGSGLRDFLSGDDGRSRRMTDLEMSQRMSGGGLVQHFKNGGEVKGYSSYDDPEGVWQKGGWAAADKKLASYKDRREISPATVLKGAVHHVYDDEGKFAGITQGMPLEGTVKEKVAALKAQKKEEKVEIKAAIEAEKNINKSPLNLAPTSTKTKEVLPPVVKNNVVRDYAVQEQKSKLDDNPLRPADNKGVPSFDAEKYISKQKIKTLGII